MSPQALAARLSKLKEAGSGELQERASLQEALVRSEEQRLAVAKALIDFQVGRRGLCGLPGWL